MKILYDYQEKAVEYCMANQHPALFMEMRLGKTIVAIEACRKWGCKRILVVAPLSVIPTWRNELTEEGIEFKQLTTKDRETFNGYNLTNYECVRNAFFDIGLEQWDAVILDESTKIRNVTAQVTKVFTALFRNVDHRLILTGLPAPEGPLNFFNQFMFLESGFMGYNNFFKFRNECFTTNAYSKYVPFRGYKERIKEYVDKRAFILKRKDVHVGSKCIYESRCIEPTDKQIEITKKLSEQFAYEDGINDLLTNWEVVISTWLSRIAGGFLPETHQCVSDRKVNEVVDLLTGELADDKVVIGFRFNHEIDEVATALRRASIKFVVMRGEISNENREQNRLVFSDENSGVNVILVQQKVGMFGLDLSVSDTMIFYSNVYSLETRKQFEDRIQNPEKKRQLLYIDLITKGSIDEDIVEALQTKKKNVEFFIGAFLKSFMQRIITVPVKN